MAQYPITVKNNGATFALHVQVNDGVSGNVEPGEAKAFSFLASHGAIITAPGATADVPVDVTNDDPTHNIKINPNDGTGPVQEAPGVTSSWTIHPTAPSNKISISKG